MGDRIDPGRLDLQADRQQEARRLAGAVFGAFEARQPDGGRAQRVPGPADMPFACEARYRPVGDFAAPGLAGKFPGGARLQPVGRQHREIEIIDAPAVEDRDAGLAGAVGAGERGMDRGGQRIDRADHLARVDRRLAGHGLFGLGRDIVAAVIGKAHVDRAVAEAALVGLAVAFEPRPLIGQAALRAAGQAAMEEAVDQPLGGGLRGDFIA